MHLLIRKLINLIWVFQQGVIDTGDGHRWDGSLRCELLEDLRCSLGDAEALEKFHHRHVHAHIDRDPILQLDSHQGIQSQIAQGLLDVELGCGKPEYASHLLTQVGLQQLLALHWFGSKEGIPLFSRMTRLQWDGGFRTRKLREQR